MVACRRLSPGGVIVNALVRSRRRQATRWPYQSATEKAYAGTHAMLLGAVEYPSLCIFPGCDCIRGEFGARLRLTIKAVLIQMQLKSQQNMPSFSHHHLVE